MVIVIVVVIIFGFVSKFNDSLTFFNGGAFGSSSEVDEKYEAFYENIEIYSKKYSADRAMMVAVLTAYGDNDNYSDMSTEDDSVEDVDPDEEKTEDNITGVSKSKMKKYIKKVAKAIKDSNYDVSRGDFNDENSGSDFFWWLYDSFIDEYYSEYLDDTNDSKNLVKKQEIIYFIYLYYEEIKEDYISGEFIYVSCPNGVTVTGENVGTYDLEKYVAGVVASENAYSKNNIIESMKAQAIAARTVALKATSNCTTPIENSTNKHTFKPDRVNSLIKKDVEETSGQVLTFNGELIEAMYDHFKKDECDNEFCYGTYIKIPSNETHKVKVPKSYLTSSGDLGGHGYGMSQVVANYMQDQGSKYDAILKYFYGDGVQISKLVSTINGGMILGAKGIYSASIFPIQDLKSVTVTHGYYYGGDAKKKYHGALDIACNAHNREACIKIPIYAAHSGVVTDISTDYCANSEYENADTTLKRVYKCGGLGVKIKITDKADPYCDYEFWYWHFEKMANNIKPGVKIETGQFLGNMGSTGSSTGWHLHFQIVNPKDQDLNQNDNIKAFGKATGLKVNNFYPTNALPKY